MGCSRGTRFTFHLLAIAFFVAGFAQPSTSDQTVVAAYLPEYRFYIDVEAAVQHLTDVILFSVSPRRDGSLDDHWLKAPDIRRVRRAADAVPGRPVNVLVCLGGAGRSEHFASVAQSKAKRDLLASNLLALAERHELDGVDFDWEAPQTPREMGDYVKLLRAARRALRPAGKLVTVALHPGQALGGAPDAAAGSSSGSHSAYGAVDRVHLMAYDMGPGHARREDAVRATQHQLQSGADPAKLVLGIPAYGRHTGNPGMVKTYAEFVDELPAEDIPLGDLAGGYTLNGPETARAKAEWARGAGLAGVVFWELGQDKVGHPQSLIRAAAEASGIATVTRTGGAENEPRRKGTETEF
mmetsp:Transcript_17285/g.39831  ORF Transcript_17285/g.39831 Transcript_17285/m.39831 type:complete len:354 (+) Transcript_17285:166-1227(+)